MIKKPKSTSTSTTPSETPLVSTNTRIGDKTLNIFGGSYHIPDNEYEEFLQLYYTEIINKHKQEYLTEKQLSVGPILIDLDMRFNYETTFTRQYTETHIKNIILLYMEELQKIFQFDDETTFPLFILEKPTINRVDEKKITKDGIHIIIGIHCDHTVQTILRSRIIEKIDSIWNDLPLVNSWEDVFDHGISQGHINWSLYGSGKPNNKTYLLTSAYQIRIDPTDGEIMMPCMDCVKYVCLENIYKLSARYAKHISLFMTSAFLKEYNKANTNSTAALRQHTTNDTSFQLLMGGKGEFQLGGSDDDTININTLVRAVRTHEQLTKCVEQFLDTITNTQIDYDMQDAYHYTMTLPESYYGSCSFCKWIRVGWALRSINIRMFIVWVAFSAKYIKFDYMSIGEMWDRWCSFDTNGGLTKKSIIYWSRQDGPIDEYNAIKDKSLDTYLERSLEKLSLHNSNDRTTKGCGDYDIAMVLHHMFKFDYICVSVKNNIWYRFKEHRWLEIDSGTTLRKSISTLLHDIYMKKWFQIANQVAHMDKEDDKRKRLETKMSIVLNICKRLMCTSDKKNIMTEAKELFYDGTFLQKIDDNPYLLCFSNGVVDFKENVFRRGTPEDYLSKCTNINYTQLNHSNVNIVKDIEDFMHKLFPSPQLYEYMWNHLASTLIGTSANQTFNMYIGVGQNGKSVLVNLMESALGDYKGDVPLTLLTQQRTKIGGLSPELVQLKGVRYAVMQEPSKGDKINEGIMKQVTGGDPLQARAPYMPQTISYIPQFKLVVCSNEFMEIKSQTHGTWRRVRVVDFESLFVDNPVDGDTLKPYQFKLDKNIKEKFDVWKEIFMSMLVDIAFITKGSVDDCERVMKASNAYREQQDYFAEFVADKICPQKGGCITKSQLAITFKEWYTTHYTSKPPSDVKQLMDKKYGNMINGVWINIRIKHESENQYDMSCENETVVSNMTMDDIDNIQLEDIGMVDHV
jgi:P4 family phage/plasmid primase-like protien